MNNDESEQSSTADDFQHQPLSSLHTKKLALSGGGKGNRENLYGKNGSMAHYSSKYMFYTSNTGAVFAPTLAELKHDNIHVEDIVGDKQGPSAAPEAPDFCSKPCFWIDIAGASADELHELGDELGLHPLTVEEIIYGTSHDKISTFGGYTFVVFRTLEAIKGGRCSCGEESCNIFACNTLLAENNIGDHISTNEATSRGRGYFYIVMKSNCVLTFHSGFAQRDIVIRVLQRLAAMRSAATDAETADFSQQHTPDSDSNNTEYYSKAESLVGLVDYPPYIVYAILDQVADQLSPEILEIERQVDAIDEQVLVLTHAQHDSALKKMGEQRRRILQTWQLAHPKPRVIEVLVRLMRAGGSTPRLAQEVVQYLSDVHGHLAAAVSSCARAEAVLARSHSNYLAKISLELSRATFDSNATTERWTMLGIIVVPINIVTSFLGVNLKVPGQDRDDTLNFFVVLACLLVYAAITLAFWRWRQLA